MPQPGERMTDGGEQGGRAIPVLNIGAMNGEADEQAGGVGDNVAFASLDLLSGIIARNTAAFRGFDALAVDDAGRRTDRKSTRLNSSHSCASRMPSSACTKKKR